MYYCRKELIISCRHHDLWDTIMIVSLWYFSDVVYSQTSYYWAPAHTILSWGLIQECFSLEVKYEYILNSEWSAELWEILQYLCNFKKWIKLWICGEKCNKECSWKEYCGMNKQESRKNNKFKRNMEVLMFLEMSGLWFYRSSNIRTFSTGDSLGSSTSSTFEMIVLCRIGLCFIKNKPWLG